MINLLKQLSACSEKERSKVIESILDSEEFQSAPVESVHTFQWIMTKKERSQYSGRLSGNRGFFEYIKSGLKNGQLESHFAKDYINQENALEMICEVNMMINNAGDDYAINTHLCVIETILRSPYISFNFIMENWNAIISRFADVNTSFHQQNNIRTIILLLWDKYREDKKHEWSEKYFTWFIQELNNCAKKNVQFFGILNNPTDWKLLIKACDKFGLYKEAESLTSLKLAA